MKTTEGKALDIGKWAILSGQVAGYLPLCIQTDEVHGRFLIFKLLHIWPFYSLTFFIIIIIWLILFLYNFSTTLKLQTYRLGSPLLGLTFCLSSLLSGLVVLTLKALGFLQVPSVTNFWHKMTESLEKLELESGQLVNLDSKEFQKLLDDTRFRFIGYCILIMIQLALFDFRETLTTLFTKGGQLSLFNLLALIFTLFHIFLILTHHGHPIWIIFFIKFYTACMLSVANKVRKLNDVNGTTNGWNKLNLRRGNQVGSLDFPITASTELILPNSGFSSSRHLNEFGQGTQPTARMNVDDTELGKIMNVVSEVEHGIEKFNQLASWRLTVEFAYQFIFLIINLVSAITVIWSGHLGLWKMLEPVIPIFLAVSALWCICSGSNDLSEGSRNVANLLEKISFKDLGWEMQQKLAILISRMSANPTHVETAFFRIDNSTLTWISAWIFLSLIVLLA